MDSRDVQPTSEKKLRRSKLPYGLLILDDRPEVVSALVRYMNLEFDRVFGALEPEEAEAILQRESPEFFLTDYWLGPGFPPATDLVPGWRKRYPCLKRVVLMSGTNSSSIPPCDAIDMIFAKPLRVAQVVDDFRSSVDDGSASASAQL